MWPDRDSMSMCCFFTSMGRWPAACTASVWNSTCFSWHRAPISSMGWMEPISLLANMMLTRAVSSRMAAATSATFTMPLSSTGRRVTSKPSFSSRARVWSTAWCSMAVEMRWVLPLRLPSRAALTMAWLSASLPPEVK